MAVRKHQKNIFGRIVLFFICFFLGWLGLDKIYMKGTWKLALVKFLLTIVAVGVIWNIYDMICALIGRYRLNPFD